MTTASRKTYHAPYSAQNVVLRTLPVDWAKVAVPMMRRVCKTWFASMKIVTRMEVEKLTVAPHHGTSQVCMLMHKKNIFIYILCWPSYSKIWCCWFFVFVYAKVHGGWSAWTTQECSTSCGLGSQLKIRSCDNPTPRKGGNICIGEDVETVICNTEDCTTGRIN